MAVCPSTHPVEWNVVSHFFHYITIKRACHFLLNWPLDQRNPLNQSTYIQRWYIKLLRQKQLRGTDTERSKVRQAEKERETQMNRWKERRRKGDEGEESAHWCWHPRVQWCFNSFVEEIVSSEILALYLIVQTQTHALTLPSAESRRGEVLHCGLCIFSSGLCDSSCQRLVCMFECARLPPSLKILQKILIFAC